MNNSVFFALLLDNWGTYLLSLLITIFPFIWLLRKVFVSIIDPLTYTIIFSILANTVPVFLFLLGEISNYYFIYFLLAETFLWSGFLLGRKIPKIKNNRIFIHEEKISMYIYIILFITFFTLTILTYKLFGIPAFMDSRMDVFTNSGGFGVIARLSPFLTTYSVFYSYYILSTYRSYIMRGFAILVLISVIVFGVLSGSRSSLLILVFAYFGFCFFYQDRFPNKKIIRNIILIAVLGAFYMFSFSAIGDNLWGTLLAFVVRLIANGDIYWFAYPNDMIAKVDIAPWYIELFSGFIFPLRLADLADYPAAIGQQLTWLNNPNLDGMAIGANSRSPVMGYVLFGWGGLVFSFVLGVCISGMVKVVRAILPGGILGSIISFHLYMQLLAMITDPMIGISFLFDSLIGLVYLFYIIVIIAPFCIKLNSI